MNKLLQFKIEETANYFAKYNRTENEVYLLNLILDLGKEYNKLVEEYNQLLYKTNGSLKSNQVRQYSTASFSAGKRV
ncbi:MAG: hypothetical protein Q8920_06230 [Bacillota bacterium]|nr:hypothetical protein [Bacillota bacterium]